MLLHVSAQALQASSHSLQCCMCACFWHSIAHAVHISAHSLHICFENSLLPAIDFTASRHISAHAWVSLIHLLSIFTSASLRLAILQLTHAVAHSEQAMMQALYFVLFIFIWYLLLFLSNCLAHTFQQ